MANEVGRGKLKTEKGLKLTAEEIDQKVKLARDAVLDAVHNSKKKLKQKEQLDFRTVGVRQTPSGKWVSMFVWYTIISLFNYYSHGEGLVDCRLLKFLTGVNYVILEHSNVMTRQHWPMRSHEKRS